MGAPRREVSTSTSSSSSSLATAFFIQKKRGKKAPLAALFFPTMMSSSSNDASYDFGGGNDDDDDGRGRRFVDVACKGNFCFPEEGASITDDDDATLRSSSSSSKTSFFTFGLTDQDGKRHFGFVLRYRRRKALTTTMTKATHSAEELEESDLKKLSDALANA